MSESIKIDDKNIDTFIDAINGNKKLPKLCNGRIEVYFPNPNVENKMYLYKRLKGKDKILLKKVVQSVIQYSNSQMIDTLHTWQDLKYQMKESIISLHIKDRKNSL